MSTSGPVACVLRPFSRCILLRLLKWLFLLAVAAALIASAGVYWYVTAYKLPFPEEKESLVLSVEPGEGVRTIVTSVQALGIKVEPQIAYGVFRYLDADRAVKVGRYRLTRGMTLLDMVRHIISGQILMTKVRFPEGQTTMNFLKLVSDHPDLTHRNGDLTEEAVRSALGLAADAPLEGQFAPDTFVVRAGLSDTEVLKQAYREQQKRVKNVWANRDGDLAVATPYEMLILASLIEKETGDDNDRKLVSSVFHNRLKKKMLLQTDPSVVYGIKDFDGVIRRSHLQADTPYNTYKRAGLPPTPIANPSMKSLEAAVHPEKSKYLYFVAKGQGLSHFSETLREHNTAVQKYLRSQGK